MYNYYFPGKCYVFSNLFLIAESLTTNNDCYAYKCNSLQIMMCINNYFLSNVLNNATLTNFKIKYQLA